MKKLIKIILIFLAGLIIYTVLEYINSWGEEDFLETLKVNIYLGIIGICIILIISLLRYLMKKKK